MLANWHPKGTSPDILTVNPKRPRLQTNNLGSLTLWNNLQSCALDLNVPEQTIWKSIRNEIPVKDFIIKPILSKSPLAWILSKEADRTHGRDSSVKKDVLAYNTILNKLYIYESARKFYTHRDLSRKAVAVRLKNRKLTMVGSWYFVYMENSEYVKALKSIMKNNSI